ncbi:hypothetical protein NBT05_12375 [Aquimarina sp. ERC-38]|uniref:hypothetical protein n=1 Tax=Aquimarina sp. ERC-38 TaxID=2949996 RepID=UPI002247565B|nr:hypothetical protein [Aquimarina sp. ERC-38]UZO79744.1 hypothetical protein NBT05_12375 [Aquimarina sp. ERC-38]
MKKVKNYIPTDLAKKKVTRYKYWCIKDETGIIITSSEDENQELSFSEILDKIIADNVDAEVQVKFGTSEQNSRLNAPLFIRINEEIEWVEPEEDEEVKVNGIPHKVDKNGNVNINFQPPKVETPIVENTSDTIRQEMEIQLEGLRKENELKEQRYQSDLHNKLAEQTLKFKELMLNERESRLRERESAIAEQEARLEERSFEMQDTLKGYARHVPGVLGSLIKEYVGVKNGKASSLGDTNKKKKIKPPITRNKVNFSFVEEEPEPTEGDTDYDNLQDIEVYDEEVIKVDETENNTISTEADNTVLTENLNN